MKIDTDEIRYVGETSLTIRGSRRRTTVPKEIVDQFGLADGSKVRWIVFKDGRILVTKVG